MSRLGLLALVGLFSVGCFAEPTWDGKQVTCQADSACQALGDGFRCDLASGLCVRPSSGTDGGSAGDGGAGGGTGDGGVECVIAEDCLTLHGEAAECGTWSCDAGVCASTPGVCPSCVDADGDGYGVGDACKGPDCDDGNTAITSDYVTDCYDGATGTENIGACRVGTIACVAGVWGTCSGQVTPTAETCNGVDDDCNNAPDDVPPIPCGEGACFKMVPACTSTAGANGAEPGLCVPDLSGATPEVANDADDDCDGLTDEGLRPCVYVSPTGDDTSDGTSGTGALQSLSLGVQRVLELNATGGATYDLCLAGGPSCTPGGFSSPGTTTTDTVLPPGTNVWGSHDPDSWARCQTVTTFIRPATARGLVYPPADVQTIVDMVEVRRIAGVDAAVGVTVEGKGLVLQNVRVVGTGPLTTAVGVDVAGSVTVRGSRIEGGPAIQTAIGIRVAGAGSLDLVDSCKDPAGGCDFDCEQSGLSVRATTDASATTTELTIGVLVEGGTRTRIANSSVCAIGGGQSAGVVITGPASEVNLEGNTITGEGLNLASGILASECGGARPRIAYNRRILAESSASKSIADGVLAYGDCHPDIIGNAELAGSTLSQTATLTSGARCSKNDAGVVSHCVVSANKFIEGANFGQADFAVGVACSGGSCDRVDHNAQVQAGSGRVTIGLALEGGRALVDSNFLLGGCPVDLARGVDATGAGSRLVNNVIWPGACTDGTTGNLAQFQGLHVKRTGSGAELDVHSNLIDGGGQATACKSRGIALDAEVDGARPNGQYRNNIIRLGRCDDAAGLDELSPNADPALLHNNFWDGEGRGQPVLYKDIDRSRIISDPSVINDLGDGVDGALNITGDPGLSNMPWGYNLAGGSDCIDMGTTEGAPETDIEGDLRTGAPDIGPDEQ